MAAAWRWSVRLFALLAMLLFAALMVIFIVVTVNHFGQKEYVTDNVGGLPPVYVLTAVLVPCCAALVIDLSFDDRGVSPVGDALEASCAGCAGCVGCVG